MNIMQINEERLRNSITSNLLRTAASEALAEFDQLKNVLTKQPRNEVDINNALATCTSKLYGMIGAIGDISNPEPLPTPPVTEIKMPEANSEVPESVPLKSEASE